MSIKLRTGTTIVVPFNQSAVDRLPVEILRDIFLRCLPGRLEHTYRACSDSISAPMYISHFCRYWRELALSHPELWSHLRVDTDYVGPRKRRLCALLEVSDTWLSRTKESPVNVSVFCSLEERDADEEHRAAEYIVTTLLSQQHRWKDVSFSWRFCPSPTFQGFKLFNMPILTSLKLSSLWNHELCVDFASSSRLEQLFLEGRCEPESRTRDERSILRNLRVLKLWSDLAVILDKLTLPSLKFLSAEDTTSNCKGDMLFNFVRCALPPLIVLELRGFDMSEEQLIAILRLLPTLEDLRINAISCIIILTRTFFNELTVSKYGGVNGSYKSERIACPVLRRLKLDCFGAQEEDLNMGPVVAFVRSRYEAFGVFRKALSKYGFLGYNRNSENLNEDLDEFGLCVEHVGFLFESDGDEEVYQFDLY